MHSDATTVEQYLSELPEDRKEPMQRLRDIMRNHLPVGFEEQMSYGMIGYVVPHSRYPDGYHCNPKLPLHFINIASQKNFIALYHAGIYVDPHLRDWFIDEYPKHCKNKLDMGKSCIRFKNVKKIPFELIEALVKKIDVETRIKLYERCNKVTDVTRKPL